MMVFLRKKAKYFYVLFILVIISFIGWGVGPKDNQTRTVLASVAGEEITLTEFWERYRSESETYRQVYAEKFDEQMQNELKDKVLNIMISSRVLYLAARDAGIRVSDEELNDHITHQSPFIRDGAFRQDVYLNVLASNRMTAKYYEETTRRDLMVRKLVSLVQASVDLTGPEVSLISQINDPEQAEQIRKSMIENKIDQALGTYVDGLRSRMNVTVNPGLIS